MGRRRARARSPNTWHQSRRWPPAAGRWSAPWEPHAGQPAGSPIAGRQYHAPQWRQTGSCPAWPSSRRPGLAGVGGASRRRLLRTLARARTWGGLRLGSRAITSSLSGPGLRTPWGRWRGSQYPPVRPRGAPGAWVAVPWGCHTVGAIGSMVGCTAGCCAGDQDGAWRSPGAGGQAAVGTPRAAATWPQRPSAAGPPGATTGAAALLLSSWGAAPARAGGTRGCHRPGATAASPTRTPLPS